MKNIFKILCCLIVIVVFWSSLSGGMFANKESPHKNKIGNGGKTGNISENTPNLSGNFSNMENLKIPIMEYNGSYKGDNLTERSIVLRMDDVQAYSWRNVSINLTDTVLANNMSITLSVIPDGMDDDVILRNYLVEKSKDSRIEIAQHGFRHTLHEFLNLSIKDENSTMTSGLDIMENSLRVRPVTFVPPYNEYDNNTTVVMSELGFGIISSGMDDYGRVNNITSFGFNTETKDRDVGLAPIDIILSECNNSLQERNICVVMIHVQDYVGKDGKMDNTKYAEFVKLLEGLKSLNAKSTTFKDLVRYKFPESNTQNVTVQSGNNSIFDGNKTIITGANLSYSNIYKWYDAPWGESPTGYTFGKNDCDRVAYLINMSQDQTLKDDARKRSLYMLDVITDPYRIRYENGLGSNKYAKFIEIYCTKK